MNKIQNVVTAKLVADSLTPHGHRMMSFLVTFPRIVLAELNTHRLLSRNSASSRAIPFLKMLEKVEQNPFIPDSFPLDHRGMVASEWVNAENEQYPEMVELWLQERDAAVRSAKRVTASTGISKQLVNRILEPFLQHTVLITGTEWTNFFALRAHGEAQREIALLAETMLNTANESVPKILQPEEWHIPFAGEFDEVHLAELVQNEPELLLATFMKISGYDSLTAAKLMIAVTRAARTSYDNFDGISDYRKDLQMGKRLAKSGHWSPFEHVAKVMSEKEYQASVRTEFSGGEMLTEHGWCGNMRGVIQARKFFARVDENRPDDRLLINS